MSDSSFLSESMPKEEKLLRGNITFRKYNYFLLFVRIRYTHIFSDQVKPVFDTVLKMALSLCTM